MQVFFKEIIYLSLVIWQLLWAHITNVLQKEDAYHTSFKLLIGIDLATQGTITKQQVPKKNLLANHVRVTPGFTNFLEVLIILPIISI
jgi:hypothetical protein